MSSQQSSKGVYAAVWRWHFYAGLYVAPFLILQALTGAAMLSKRPIERWQLGTMLQNSGVINTTHQQRWEAAQAAVPGATVTRYQPGRAAETSRVTVTAGPRSYTVFVDAHTAAVTGTIDDADRIDLIADRLHGTLLMGRAGDRLIEIAASLAIMLVSSGLYLWLPKLGSWAQSFRVVRGSRRLAWRSLHTTIGVALAPVLVFYLVSGLAWTDVWGERFVQSWSSLRTAQAAPGEDLSHGHGALNGDSSRIVPWGLEQTPLPDASHAEHASPDVAGRLSLDQAITIAQREGIGQRFWVAVPPGTDRVWTIGQTVMNEDVVDPRRELIVHLDRRTGEVIGRVGWADYGLGARAMAAGIPLHMGLLGWWNYLGALAVCLSVLGLSVAGLAMWWLRRPSREWRLAAPPRPADVRVPVGIWIVAVTLAVAFPMAGITIAAIAALDWLVVRRVPRLKAFVN